MKLELGLWAGARHGDEDQGEDLDGDEGGLLIKLKCEALVSPPIMWNAIGVSKIVRSHRANRETDKVKWQSFSESVTVEGREELTMEKLSMSSVE